MTWRSPAVLAVIGVCATLVLALVVVIALLRTGGAKAVSDNAALIAALLALSGIFTTQLFSIVREDRRTRTESTRTAQREQDSALQAFRDQISHSDTYSELRTAAASGHKRAIQRAKLQTLLLQLAEERKGMLLSFLHEAKLIRKNEITPNEHTKEGSEKTDEERWRYPILRLDHLDFSRTELNPDTKLTFDDLRGIILRSAKLSNVNLSGANLKNADLRDADLSGAALRKPNRQDSERIPGEFYSEVDKARIRGKFPEGLMETDLSGADLSGTDLSGAVGITNEELEQQAKSLKDAIMPDGSKHP